MCDRVVCGRVRSVARFVMMDFREYLYQLYNDEVTSGPRSCAGSCDNGDISRNLNILIPAVLSILLTRRACARMCVCMLILCGFIANFIDYSV